MFALGRDLTPVSYSLKSWTLDPALPMTCCKVLALLSHLVAPPIPVPLCGARPLSLLAPGEGTGVPLCSDSTRRLSADRGSGYGSNTHNEPTGEASGEHFASLFSHTQICTLIQ